MSHRQGYKVCVLFYFSTSAWKGARLASPRHSGPQLLDIMGLQQLVHPPADWNTAGSQEANQADQLRTAQSGHRLHANHGKIVTYTTKIWIGLFHSKS